MIWFLAGCVGTGMLDRFTRERVMAKATDVADVDQACATGAALTHALAAVTRRKASAHQALLIGELNAALCAEARAWEPEIEAARVLGDPASFGPRAGATAQDALLHAEREHAVAAGRFWRAHQHLVAEWGEPGEGACPRFRSEAEELTYLLGLWAGVNALMHDKAGANAVGVPLDVPTKVARGCDCVDNERFWHVPQTLQAASWSAIPGSEPSGVDPWVLMQEQAGAGENSGVRLAHAIVARVAANAGRDDVLTDTLLAQGAAHEGTASSQDFALFDRYAYEVSLHEADLVWARAEGHRAKGLGLPVEAQQSEVPVGEDPFAEDPVSAP